MRVIIAGTRTITDYEAVCQAIRSSGFEITEVVSGHAQGVDRLGELWAHKHGLEVKLFKPQWDIQGKVAGPIRNRQMAEYAEALIAVWDSKSLGTKNMIDTAKRLGLKIFVFTQSSQER